MILRRLDLLNGEADAVKAEADAVVDHIEYLKQYLIAKTDGLDTIDFGYVNDYKNASNETAREAASLW